jgi:hypothetical protein
MTDHFVKSLAESCGALVLWGFVRAQGMRHTRREPC